MLVASVHVPDDGRDDTAAMQRALDSLAVGQWLVFPAGTYLHNSRLVVATAGVVLWSEGATLQASNPFDQAVELAANGASIYNFTLTAVTGERLYAPWHSRIAIYGGIARGAPLRDNVIQGNRIINGSAPGTALANSSSSSGISPINWDTSVQRTGHGAVEVHGFVFDDERAFTELAEATAMQNIRITRTTVTDAWAAGVRVGVGAGVFEVLEGSDAAGRWVSRAFTGGALRRVEPSSITMSGTASPAVEILARTTNIDNVYCEGLSEGGRVATDAACGGARPVVTGSTRSCLR